MPLGRLPNGISEPSLSYFVDYANRSLSTIVIEVCRPLLSKKYFSDLENSLFRFAYLPFSLSKYFLSYLAGNLFWLRTYRVAIKVCENRYS